MIDNMVIDLWSYENFASFEDVRRKYNIIVNLSKFISNKKILNEIVALGYNQFVHKPCPYVLEIGGT